MDLMNNYSGKKNLLFKFLLLVSILMISPWQMRAQDTVNIMIRNVRMIDRDGQTEDQNVSILIKNTKLNVITTEEIDIKNGIIGYDAENGIVLGLLDIGEKANFIILNQDPREAIDVLSDTKNHLIFSIHNGIIINNSLALINDLKSETKKRKKLGWMAYTPPPMALPLTYQDKTKWNRWETRPISGIFVAAVALDRQRWFGQDTNSEQQVGDLNDYEGGQIRAFRVGIAGSLNFKKPWIYTFVIATHAFDQGFNSEERDEATLLDYRLDIPVWKQISLSLGKMKEPISMERLLLGTQLQMQERSAIVDAMYPVRNVGINVNGTSFKQRMTWSAGVFNDWFDASQTFKESSNEVVGRLTGLPFVTEDDSHLLHLGFGIRYTDAREGLRYFSRPEFNQAPMYLDTDSINGDNSIVYDFEISWRRGPFWVSGEYLMNRVSAPFFGDPTFPGFHLTGSWIITKEMRTYNKRIGTFGPVPVSRSVFQGGPGSWELTTRFTRTDLNGGLVTGGEMNIYSLGVNWWVTPIFGVNINYRYIVLDRFGIRGHSNGIMYRVILMLE